MYFKKTSNTEKIVSMKSKGLSLKKITTLTTTHNNLSLSNK